MTDDEIKALALSLSRKAGFAAVGGSTLTMCSGDDIERFARLCIAQGLEMGAAWCADRGWNLDEDDVPSVLRDMAAEMRK